jgi:hypothetical protein
VLPGDERLDAYFVGAVPDPFMIQVYPLRPDKRAIIPAVTHGDGSGRLQTVNRQANPLYRQLLKGFETLTGVPVLLNTSFNENEPIADRPHARRGSGRLSVHADGWAGVGNIRGGERELTARRQGCRHGGKA